MSLDEQQLFQGNCEHPVRFCRLRVDFCPCFSPSFAGGHTIPRTCSASARSQTCLALRSIELGVCVLGLTGSPSRTSDSRAALPGDRLPLPCDIFPAVSQSYEARVTECHGTTGEHSSPTQAERRGGHRSTGNSATEKRKLSSYHLLTHGPCSAFPWFPWMMPAATPA